MSHNEVLLGQVNPSHNRCLGKKEGIWSGGDTWEKAKDAGDRGQCGVSGQQGTHRLSCDHTWLEEARRGSLARETWGEAGLAYACISDAWPRELWEEAGIV